MYQLVYLGGGREAVRCPSSGRTCHIVARDNDTWAVEEDRRQALFRSHGDALDCARELAGDLDLPPLEQA